MKITIYTAFNKRHAVSRLFCMGIARFMAAAPQGYEVNLHAVISEEESIALCQEFGFTFTRTTNDYLGKKWNTGLLYILKNHQPDYVLVMGDDDLISSEAWAHYQQGIENQWPYFGYNSIYFYSPAYNRARLYAYRETGSKQKLWGCGRMIATYAIERSAWNASVKFKSEYNHGGVRFTKGEEVMLPVYQANYFVGMQVAEFTGAPEFSFWDNTQQRGLDNESEIRLLMNGFDPIAFLPEKPVMVDIKTADNVWDFTHYISLGKSAETTDATAFLSDEERNYIAQHFANQPVVKLPFKEFVPGIRTAQEIINDEYRTIVSHANYDKNGTHMLDFSKITFTRQPDHPNYTEAWKNFKTPKAQFLCGIHREMDGDIIRLHIVNDPKMSKVV